MTKTPKRLNQAATVDIPPSRQQQWDPAVTYDLGEVLAKDVAQEMIQFTSWIVGTTPLIVHAWSEKAKRQMLEKQRGAAKAGKEERHPTEDFRSALYEIDPGVYGFPAMAIKNSFLSAAHKDKNIPRTTAQSGLWIDGQLTRLRPGLSGAICDMPLLRIYGSEPEMREDMVSIGAGFKKVANLAYRPQFSVWAIRVTGRTNPLLINPHKLSRLATDAGQSVGIGEWRAEKKGYFGAYHLADVAETRAWDLYASGQGPLPIPDNYVAEAA